MLVDLSVLIKEGMPVYEGDPPTKIEPAGNLTKDGYEDHYLSIGTHAGTHVDAPAHMIAGGKTLDEFPLDKFTGRGVLIKVDGQFELDEIKQAGIKSGDVVLFHTGMSDFYYELNYYDDYPTMPEEVAEYLVERKVKMVGVDMCSPDHEPFHAHKILLGANILIIENLTNLGELTGQEFTVSAFPVKLDIDGAPARVMAEVTDAR